ncbi:hypothetical protein KSP39_PZI020271 [Platanthera zijinensis]|uniref:Uncharacterized protein n=1 Tax=Platanthera zijinensis TaxID=2320716 RepID=A0AAP0FWW9_9ASPA
MIGDHRQGRRTPANPPGVSCRRSGRATVGGGPTGAPPEYPCRVRWGPTSPPVGSGKAGGDRGGSRIRRAGREADAFLCRISKGFRELLWADGRKTGGDWRAGGGHCRVRGEKAVWGAGQKACGIDLLILLLTGNSEEVCFDWRVLGRRGHGRGHLGNLNVTPRAPPCPLDPPLGGGSVANNNLVKNGRAAQKGSREGGTGEAFLLHKRGKPELGGVLSSRDFLKPAETPVAGTDCGKTNGFITNLCILIKRNAAKR